MVGQPRHADPAARLVAVVGEPVRITASVTVDVGRRVWGKVADLVM